jgi:hypothetical protein
VQGAVLIWARQRKSKALRRTDGSRNTDSCRILALPGLQARPAPLFETRLKAVDETNGVRDGISRPTRNWPSQHKRARLGRDDSRRQVALYVISPEPLFVNFTMPPCWGHGGEISSHKTLDQPLGESAALPGKASSSEQRKGSSGNLFRSRNLAGPHRCADADRAVWRPAISKAVPPVGGSSSQVIGPFRQPHHDGAPRWCGW